MEALQQYSEETAYFAVRVFVGLLFFFQGYQKIFSIKIKEVLQTFAPALREKGVPQFLIFTGVWITSVVEFLFGLFLIVGLFTPICLYALLIDVLAVSFAFGIMRPMWDMQYIFPRLVTLVFLLVAPSSWNLISLDHLFNIK